MRVKKTPPPRLARTITVRRKPGHPTRALLTFAGRTEEAALGRSGISSRKREGDGATPIAAMRLVGGYLRHDKGITRPQTRLPLRFTPSNLLWCDEPRHALYNRPVPAPFTPSHEKMCRDDGLYDVCIVMDWNCGNGNATAARPSSSTSPNPAIRRPKAVSPSACRR